MLTSYIASLKKVFASLESKNYRLYFAGQGISLIGTWMQNIAMSWLVYRITGSVFLLGLVSFTSQIPTFILSPFAGVITDKFNRHKIMIATQVFFMLQASILALLVFLNIVHPWHIITLSLFFGFISAFDAPARQSLVIDLIDKPENLGNAIALNSALFNGARLIGPGVAGITIALVGEGICFLINALTYISVIWALLSIKIQINKQVKTNTNLKKSLSDGFTYTFGFPPIRVLIILLAFISLTGLSYIVLLPAYAKDILHGGSDTLGFLMSATGAGALTGALYLASRKSVLGLGKLISVSTVIFGVAVIITAYSKIMFLSILALYFSGLTMILSIASINTLIQTFSDEEKRGRVMSFYSMALLGTNPIGNLLAGTIASGLGIIFTLVIGGLSSIVAGIWFGNNRSKLRKYVHPIYVSKGIILDENNSLSPNS